MRSPSPRPAKRASTRKRGQPSAKSGAKKAAPKAASSPRIKRPSQIPASQWRDLGPTTRNRYAKYFAKHPGATITQARGHKPQEHKGRLDRWRDRAMAFAERQARRFPGDIAEMAKANFEALDQRRREYGEGDLARFQALVRTLEERRDRAPRGKNSRPEPIGVDLEELSESYDVPAEVFGYH